MARLSVMPRFVERRRNPPGIPSGLRSTISSNAIRVRRIRRLVRALAFKWIRILYRCWQTYNEARIPASNAVVHPSCTTWRTCLERNNNPYYSSQSSSCYCQMRTGMSAMSGRRMEGSVWSCARSSALSRPWRSTASSCARARKPRAVLTRCGLPLPSTSWPTSNITRCLTEKVYLPTIVCGHVLWHLGSSRDASAALFTQS